MQLMQFRAGLFDIYVGVPVFFFFFFFFGGDILYVKLNHPDLVNTGSFFSQSTNIKHVQPNDRSCTLRFKCKWFINIKCPLFCFFPFFMELVLVIHHSPYPGPTTHHMIIGFETQVYNNFLRGMFYFFHILIFWVVRSINVQKLPKMGHQSFFTIYQNIM